MKRRIPKFFAALLAATLLPTAFAVRDALAEPDDSEEESGKEESAAASPVEDLSRKKRKLLESLVHDDTVLVNVAKKDLPASPDVLDLGRRATLALARCVADNVDDAVRITCASLLGRIGDRAALPALQGALEAWNPGVRRAAIGALRSMPDASSFEPLKKLLDRDDEEHENRAATYRTLGVLADQRAVKVLREALRKQTTLREAAFEGLWKSRHLLARSTLISDVAWAIGSDDVALIVRAERAASELRAPELVEALIPRMEHPDTHVRNRAVYALGRIGDSAATTALLARIPKVREARMLNNIAFALERLDPKAFFATIAQLAAHDQAAIRMNAAFVLGDVRRPEGVKMLTAALADKNDFVRVSAVSALGKLDAPEAIPALEPFVKDANKTLRIEAIHAIYELSGMTRKELVYDNLFSSTNPSIKLRATLALARALDPRVAQDVLLCVERASCALRDVEPYLLAAPDASIPGRMLLSWVQGRSDLTNLVAVQKPPAAGPIAWSDVSASLAHGAFGRAGFAMDLLGDLGEPTAPALLEPLLLHEKTHVRLHAAVALARSKAASAAKADAVLLAAFDTVPADWLPSVARAIGRIREADVRARLGKEFLAREKSADAAIAVAAAAIRLDWDPEGAIFRFLDGLAGTSARERELCERTLLRARGPLVTPLLRRALARETRPVVKDTLRKILDVRAGAGDGT